MKDHPCDCKRRPSYDRPPLRTRAGIAVAAALCSAVVLGSALLGFDMQARSGQAAAAPVALTSCLSALNPRSCSAA